MITPIAAQYAPVTLPDAPTASDLRRPIEPYQAMIVTQLRAILVRTERSEHYPWIDTKINLITGEGLPPAHPLLGRDLVSGWVQGRGLESVVMFAAWLAPFAGDGEVDRLIARPPPGCRPPGAAPAGTHGQRGSSVLLHDPGRAGV